MNYIYAKVQDLHLKYKIYTKSTRLTSKYEIYTNVQDLHQK